MCTLYIFSCDREVSVPISCTAPPVSAYNVPKIIEVCNALLYVVTFPP